MTAGGVTITRERQPTPYAGAIEGYIDGLNSRRGAVFSSNYEYPGRYTRWDTAIIDPPLVITARGREMRIEALNGRGEVLLPTLGRALERLAEITHRRDGRKLIRLEVKKPGRVFTEEERSRGPSVFSVLRAHHGAVPDRRRQPISASMAPSATISPSSSIRSSTGSPQAGDQRDLVLFLPDEILVVDHYAAKAWSDRYDFSGEGFSTQGLPRDESPSRSGRPTRIPPRGDHEPGE